MALCLTNLFICCLVCISVSSFFNNPIFLKERFNIENSIVFSNRIKVDTPISLIKKLRQLTGVGVVDCKNALHEANNDLLKATKQVVQKGYKKTFSKSHKIANEGKIIVRFNSDNKKAVLIEINCQTDFVSNSETLTKFGKEVANFAMLMANRNEKIDILSIRDTFEKSRVEIATSVGENINIHSVRCLEAKNRDKIGFYIHSGGRIGVVVTGNCNFDLLKKLSMHICASTPQFITQLKGISKCSLSLLSQPYILNPKITVSNILARESCLVRSFIRLEIGADCISQPN